MEENRLNGLGRLSPHGRYEGEERRISHGTWLGNERRVDEPLSEQDHPEEYEPQ